MHFQKYTLGVTKPPFNPNSKTFIITPQIYSSFSTDRQTGKIFIQENIPRLLWTDSFKGVWKKKF